MNNVYLKNIIRFVVLVVIQVIILDRINFKGYVNPYLYIYFILLLPIDVSKWGLLILAFLLGSTVDLFSHTPGMHAAATVLMAFSRPLIIKSLSSRGESEPGISPGIAEMGFNWFFVYSLILIFIHHIFLFYLEVFRFSNFFDTLMRALYSVIFTLILVILSQFLFYKSKK